MHLPLSNYKLLLFLLLVPFLSNAQTAGSGTLASIEAKADAIVQNDEKVGALNRQRMETYSLEQEKLHKLKQDLSNLQAEKTNALNELRQGYFCSDCKRPKSEVERQEGITFAAHIRAGASGGRKMVPATQELLDSKAAEYDQKISAKAQELKTFELSENEFTRKRADIDKQMDQLKDKSDRLREEIVELSKRYKEQVVQEAKSYQSSWASDLMRLVAEKHFIEDRIDIYNVKYGDLATEEAKATSEIKEKVRKQNEADIQHLNGKIAAANAKLGNQEQVFRQNSDNLNNTLFKLNQRLNEVKQKLAKPADLTPDQKNQLEAEKLDLEGKIDANKSETAGISTTFKQNKQSLETDIKTYKDKTWQLTSNLSKRQDDALAGLKSAYETKRKVLNEAIEARKVSLQNKGDLLIQKKAAYRQKNNQYASKVDAERIRLINACQKAGCSCYGIDTHSTVVGNWSAASGCVSAMESSKSINAYYGCTEEAPVYKQHYASFVDGLSDSDLNALQRRTTKTQYDLILQKVTK